MAVSSVRELFENALPEKLKGRPELVEQINSKFKFEVSGDEESTWVVDLTTPGGAVTESTDDANCTVSVGGTDLVDIVNGKQNAQMAFMSGKLKVSGDLGLALKLGQLFS